jgi:acetoacetyl-CoA reductase
MSSRVALVTGGTRGIGAAIAWALKQAGHRVAVNFAGNQAAAKKFTEQTEIPAYSWDVSDFDACAAGVQQVEADLGPIEILINNAGITRDGFLHKMTPDQWTAVLVTNLNSCFNMSRQVIEGMRARSYGRIINIASINGQKGQVGQTNYGAAKAGVIGFTKALALESASKGITVNAIAPGYINTEMVAAVQPEVLQKVIAAIPAGRLGMAEELAHAVLFLVDDRAAFVNGETLSINGGQYMA